MNRRWIPAIALIAGATLGGLPAGAEDALVVSKALSPELALDAAKAALTECRKQGFQVAVAVVDRSGLPELLAGQSARSPKRWAEESSRFVRELPGR